MQCLRVFSLRLIKSQHSCRFMAEGTSIYELMEICDRVSVLRDGQKVSEGYVKDYTVDRIISAMVGKELKNQYPKAEVSIGAVSYTHLDVYKRQVHHCVHQLF